MCVTMANVGHLLPKRTVITREGPEAIPISTGDLTE